VTVRPALPAQESAGSSQLRAAGRDDDAMAALRQAIVLNPEHAELTGALVAWEGAAPAGS
jgi:hypothetical protein